ncbi:FAD/NAD(P)-binding oxidoreductase [Sedimentitalea sp. CY04]|uniref:FAD/NAD(P)-binding oxidoreductase n=1 Tax=Parasedimentitalea denitrificans TaxID=2211118 RepID=A0ABX0WFC1_9RHOB|nr:NAD(P)/FAD-dependent oxidoreductase [Sedimentitalea sp. CY04]NIZ63440.1 FAD/NAD(P)-binding oxidoreductase [Sedimentitalea sp. CY04]
MPEARWDVIVIGGGVVGCAVTRRFALAGAKTLLLERGRDILSGASKANSAILHTGFDAPPGSLEVACMQAGYKEYLDIHARLNLPMLKTAALVVAWTEEQLAQLDGIVSKAHENGVDDARQISRKDLLSREDGLSKTALGAVEVPREYVIDPWSAPLAYLKQAVRAGAGYQFDTEIKSGAFDGEYWHLDTGQQRFSGRLVINCTGTNGDNIEHICRKPGFEIRPRKGQFLVYDKSASALINSIILPVPTATTKGVVLTKTIFGNLLLGPTAEEQQDRNVATVEREMLEGLIATGTEMLPGLAGHSVTATYAGLRPATQFKDYQISAEPGKNWIGVNGIRSTGLTAALGIAAFVEKLCSETYSDIADFRPAPIPDWPVMPVLAEHGKRAYQQGDGTEIVCHCERVTRGEIEAALDESDVPARSLGGLRRRTRVMMGRCNGFYCSARVAELTQGRISPPLAGHKKDQT